MATPSIPPRPRLARTLPALLLLALAALAWAQSAAVRIVVIGDSTVSNYAASKYPMAGWGQVLSLFFRGGTVAVVNNAIGGRSSRSFIEDGHWATTLAGLRAGDILLVQFGHNDRDFSKPERYTDTTAYKKCLAQYAREARAKGAHPVFVTPMNMNTWNGTTVREVFTEGANNYRAAMIHAAADLKVPVLDLEKKSKLLMDTLGQAYLAKFHFLGLDAGEYPAYPTGISDGTHFQEMGALENARMVVEEIARQPADSVLKLLAPLVAPLQPVQVATNLANGGTITRSRRFPAGATVTLKVRPAAGKTFRYWADERGDSVTGTQRHSFRMEAVARTFTAVFAGGSPVVSLRRSAPLPASVRLDGSMLRIASPSPLRSVVLTDPAGHVLLERRLSGTRAAIDLAPLPAVPLVVRLSTDAGTETRHLPGGR